MVKVGYQLIVAGYQIIVAVEQNTSSRHEIYQTSDHFSVLAIKRSHLITCLSL